MNRNIIIGLVAAALLAVGAFLVFSGGDEDNGNNQEQSSQQSADGEEQLNDIMPTAGQAFTAEVTTTESDGTVTTGQLRYNGENSWSWSGETEDGTVEARVVDGVLYTYDAGSDQWFSLGTNTSAASIDTSQYDYDSEELNAFKSQATHLGQQPCPAGTCETWQATDYEGNDTFTIGFDSDGRISRVSGVSNDGTEVLIDYTFDGEVNIEVPANVQTFEVPSTP